MSKIEPKVFIAKFISDLEIRRDSYLQDLSNKLERDPDKLTGKAAHGLNGRYRECDEILDMMRAGLVRMQ